MSSPKSARKRHDVARPAHGDRGRAEGVLENQVPADDPREELAQRGVAVGVGRAGNRHARRELRVAQARERTGHARQQHRQHDGRPRVLRRGLARQHEDPGADDGPDPERDQVDADQARASGCARRSRRPRPAAAPWTSWRIAETSVLLLRHQRLRPRPGGAGPRRLHPAGSGHYIGGSGLGTG